MGKPKQTLGGKSQHSYDATGRAFGEVGRADQQPESRFLDYFWYFGSTKCNTKTNKVNVS